MKKINAKERTTFQNEGNQQDVYKERKLVETTGTKLTV